MSDLQSMAIVIPVYKVNLADFEAKALRRLNQLFTQNVFLMAPEGMDVSAYKEIAPGLQVQYFDKKHFTGIPSYNQFLLAPEFYQSFLDKGFAWMLLHQLDAYLFHPRIEPFLKSPYDYFGAPWPGGQLLSPTFKNGYLLKFFGKRVYVGNGGFSLRRLSAVVELLTRKKSAAQVWPSNEDGFFSYYGHADTKFRSCPVEVARAFAFEKNPRELLKENQGQLPFGCHAFNKYDCDFYDEHLDRFLAKEEI